MLDFPYGIYHGTLFEKVNTWVSVLSLGCAAVTDPPERPRTLNALVRLMLNPDDPATLSDDTLIRAAIEAREAKKLAECSAAAELSRRGWSWRRIGKALGVDHSTAYGWVRDAGLLPAQVLTRDDRAMPEPATAPERPPVAAAIVTSHRGVLVGRRNDGKPLWTFIAGEVEPGESIADAAVREVKEETGLEVRAGHHEIGRRVHPSTGRTMIYLACSPTGGTDVFVGDPVELAEVRWLSLAEVDELMNVFEPVRDHLARVIS